MEKFSIPTIKRDQFLGQIVNELSSRLEDAILENMVSETDFYNADVAVEKNKVLYQLSYSWSGGNTLVIMKDNRDSNFYNVEDYILSHIDFYSIEGNASTRYERELQYCAYQK